MLFFPIVTIAFLGLLENITCPSSGNISNKCTREKVGKETIIVATIDEICPRDNCSAAETRRRDLIEILPFVERRLRFS